MIEALGVQLDIIEKTDGNGAPGGVELSDLDVLDRNTGGLGQGSDELFCSRVAVIIAQREIDCVGRSRCRYWSRSEDVRGHFCLDLG